MTSEGTNHGAGSGRVSRISQFAPFAGIALVALIALSEHLALNRIFQVDELQHVFTARLLVTDPARDYVASASLMHLGPMSWIASGIDRAALLLRAERLPFVVLLWLNIFLIGRCGGFHLRSPNLLWGLLFAATCAPLWDYGFEIRHDNALLTAMLLTWLFARPTLVGARRQLVLVGAMAALGQFIAFKAFVYLVPIVIFALLAAVIRDGRRPAAAVLSVLAGVAIASLGAFIAHSAAGTWEIYLDDVVALRETASDAFRFGAGSTLFRLVIQAPTLLLAATCALPLVVRHLRARKLVGRESIVPEMAFVLVGIGAILVNPTPYPYNLVLLVPQLAILVLRAFTIAAPLRRHARATPVLVAFFVMHVLIWGTFTVRHLRMSNDRQVELMTLAEEMTDPRQHRVFDGTGLVPTRRPPGRNWLIHTFTIRKFLDGTFPPIRAQLAEGKTPVVIPNYRTARLAPGDLRFIEKNYVAMAGDFLVAGRVAGTGTSTWTCLVPGRYFVAFDSQRGTASLDGVPLRSGPLVIGSGAHRLEVSGIPQAHIVWLGPSLTAPPSLGPGEADRTLVNWY